MCLDGLATTLEDTRAASLADDLLARVVLLSGASAPCLAQLAAGLLGVAAELAGLELIGRDLKIPYLRRVFARRFFSKSRSMPTANAEDLCRSGGT